MPPGDKRSSRTASGGPDEAAVADELYTAPPARFVALREERAADAKAAGQGDAARRIHALRRPTLSAWAGNLLVRRQPGEVRRFLQLGEELRRAHHDLDPDQLRELSAQQWRVISALSRQAAQLALDAGHRISDAAQREVENTLRAVMADAGAADRWATGRLEGPLTPPTELPPASPDALSATDRPAPAPRRAPGRQSGSSPTDRDGRRKREDDLAERRRRRERELAQARKGAEEAERRLRALRKEQTAARSAERRARAGGERARRRAETLQRQLREAQEETDRAGAEERHAASQREAADAAVARAERAAHDAAREAERLGSRTKA